MTEKSLRELAEERVDEMGFSEQQKSVIFYDWPEGDEHLEWLLTATKSEITDWVAVVG